MDYSEILLDLDYARGVAVLTINRPQRHNALNSSIRVEMTDAVSRVADDPGIGSLVLIGAGERAFSVGADLKDPTSNHSTSDFEEYQRGQQRKGGWYQLLTHYPKAVIAAVNGYCAGSGLQLALTSDILIGTSSAQFWIPQIKLGLAPHVGTLLKLARIMGQQRMLEMILTGRRLSAAEALQYGLLSHVVELPQLLERAKDIGATIAEQPRLAVEMTKRSYFQALDLSWEQAMAMDSLKQFGMWQTDARREGHAAFTDAKRVERKEQA